MVDINLSGKTKIVTLIGNPVEHSMSPRMHTVAFKEIGVDAIYIATRVDNDKVGSAINGIRAFNFLGANVTIPHKIEAMKYVDEIDPLAQQIGAINTIVNDDGYLRATNTDGLGFMRSLKEANVTLKNKRAVMVGAGGAARAISFYLLTEVDELLMTDIKKEVAMALISNLKKTYGEKKISFFESTKENLKEALEPAHLLLNCTPVGMSPQADKTPVSADLLRSDLVVFDAVYNPLETLLIKNARAKGALTISGIKMFLYQGVEAFERWTKKKAPVEIMEKIIIEGLTKKK
ncbi:MAG: shikimate dehydrogenase [Candidatus Helarchaeota archaeon]